MKLDEYKNRKAFTTPDGYFQQLNERIAESTTRVQKSGRSIGFWTRAVGYAASIAIIAVIATTALSTYKSSKSVAMNEYADEEYLDSEYIDNMLQNYPIDDYTFYCCITGTDMN